MCAIYKSILALIALILFIFVSDWDCIYHSSIVEPRRVKKIQRERAKLEKAKLKEQKNK